ncbi:HlyD family secretion protein [Dickeya solani]|uniref:HlyD family secretion protein n=1 Tax=Dickeya solani TaxID=1089444 RepID=A0AAX4EXB1_9GAMM|nr:HlyD family secretion protein [Dickeya solani]WOA52074.1 HlyD family secretion protein [Dickeya solani]
MTPEQRFNRWVQSVLVIFLIAFFYFIFADAYMPVTPESRLIRKVIPVASQVSGRVVTVAVKSGQHVENKQVLFTIDDRSFRLAVAKAKLNLEQAERDNRELDAQIASANADREAARIDADNLLRDLRRYDSLKSGNAVSAQTLDNSRTNYQIAAKKLAAADAKIGQLQLQRGETGNNNLQLRLARNTLSDAELALSYTQVRAESAGVVTNLQLIPGDFSATGNPVMALVSDKPDIVADFREKSLRKVTPGSFALISFDRIPGKTFKAHVSEFDEGVSNGQYSANGSLASPDVTDRWVRDAQRMRIHLILDEGTNQLLPTGARATVQLLPGDNFVTHLLGKMQINLISEIHYVY